MANLPFPIVPCVDFSEEAITSRRKQEGPGMENWGDIDSFCARHGLFQEKFVEELVFTPEHQWLQKVRPQQEQPPSQYLNTARLSPALLIDLCNNTRVLQKFLGHTTAPEKPVEALQLLSNHSGQFRCVKPSDDLEEASDLNPKLSVGSEKLSTEKIMRLAGERFIEFSAQKFININMLFHPHGSSLSHLSPEEKQDVELAQLLLAAAEKVSDKQYNRASKLLAQCEATASKTGTTPAQRAVFYFAKALREKIDRETGCFAPKNSEDDGCSRSWSRNNLAFLAWHQKIPFTQVMHFTGIQAILESAEMKSQVHVIDLQMRTGLQWAVLMQALAEKSEKPTKHLKITAVETSDEQKVEETGKRLRSFARSLNLRFSFKVVLVSDIKDLSAEQFKIEPDESLAVYCSLVLRTLISKPISLENVMRVVRKLNPFIMVVTEVEANHNSPTFINRFIEALFFYATCFDCLEETMEQENEYRMAIEVTYGDGIRNIVGSEGSERTTRSVRIDVWRTFFAKFGMMEMELSKSCLYQAELILQQFGRGSSCSLEMCGKSLILGWKGIPIHSVSAWKFH